MVLGLFLLAIFDRYLVGEFGARGETSGLLLWAGFGAAVLLTVRGIRTIPNKAIVEAGKWSAWDRAEYYSFLFSNVGILLVGVIFSPDWDGAPYCLISLLFGLPALIRKLYATLD